MYQQCEVTFQPTGGNRFHCVLQSGHYGECELQVPMSAIASVKVEAKSPRFRLKFSDADIPLCAHGGRQVFDIRDIYDLRSDATLRRVGCSECATKIVKILNEGQ